MDEKVILSPRRSVHLKSGNLNPRLLNPITGVSSNLAVGTREMLAAMAVRPAYLTTTGPRL
jgi:hypothetical protein